MIKKILLILSLVFIPYFTFSASISTVGVNRLNNDHIEPLVRTDYFRASYLNATSTTATSTFANGLTLTGGCFQLNGNCIYSGAGSAGVLGSIQFSTGGGGFGASGNLFWSTTKNAVGIGTTTPQWGLNIVGTAPTTATLGISDPTAALNQKHWVFSSIGGTLYVGTSTDVFATSTPSALTLLNSGNIGIGTTSPYAPLSVTGLSAASNFSADSSTATSTFRGGLVAAGIAGLTVLQNGNVGINNITPNAPLSFPPVTGNKIILYPIGVGTGYGIAIGSGLLQVIADTGAKVGIGTGSTGSFTQTLTVTGSNVGIGTTTPNWPLQVAGTRPSVVISDTSAAVDSKHWTISNQGGNLYFATSTDALATSSTPAIVIQGNSGGSANPLRGVTIGTSTEGQVQAIKSIVSYGLDPIAGTASSTGDHSGRTQDSIIDAGGTARCAFWDVNGAYVTIPGRCPNR